MPTQFGPAALDYTFSFSAYPTGTLITQTIDVGNTTGLEWIDGIFIDNSIGTSAFIFKCVDTNQIFYVPGGTQALYPLLGLIGATVNVTGLSGAQIDVPVKFTNIEFQATQWNATAASASNVNIVGNVPVVPVSRAGSAPAAQTIAAGGTWQSLYNILPSRWRLFISNPASSASQNIGGAPESLYIFFGAISTPFVIANGGFHEITPGGIFDTGDGICESSPISIVANTTGHNFFARQYS